MKKIWVCYIKRKRGFTLVELLLTMGILTIVTSIGTLSFAAIRNTSDIDYTAARLKGLFLRSQTETANGKSSGVYVESGKVVFFYGQDYNPVDPSNEEWILPSNISASSITLTDQEITFDPVTGYPEEYTSPYEVVLTIGGGGVSRTVIVNDVGIIDIL